MSQENPLKQLQNFGQSIWLDYLRRNLITSGGLQRLIDEDGLRGMTSNPSIFEKAIDGSHDYDEDIRVMALERKNAHEIYEKLTIQDIQLATDTFRPLYDSSQGQNGFVSLEVSPHLARDTQGTIAEARRLWKAVDRPNVMIKVPGTLEGLPAIEQLISEGINVNITLLFGLPRYQKVAHAYINGLQKRLDQGSPIDRIASVASFFLSRIDVLVDPRLEEKMRGEGDLADMAGRLHGQIAIASAKVAYQLYKEIFDTIEFKKLAEQGAHTQRLLWASTSTKNPAYSDVKYVETLIGPDTINTVPQETLNAYRDHGDPHNTLEDELEEYQYALDHLEDLEIDIDELTGQLVEEGIEKFNKPYDRLLDTLNKKIEQAEVAPVDRQSFFLGEYQEDYEGRLDSLKQAQFSDRLWRKDASLWQYDPKTQDGASHAMGWLHIAEKMEEHLPNLLKFADQVFEQGFKHVVHMGMGGSSLAPMVFAQTFRPEGKGLPVTVLDTTSPDRILEIEKNIPLKDTLFIVASKSGTTAEPIAFEDYFYAKVRELKGDQAGENFVVITDPGTPLARQAELRKYRHIFLNYADIGGRYSALSYFGLLPAALMGLDVTELLGRALRMRHKSDHCIPMDENPAIKLGAVLGELALHGRDKVTFLTSKRISTFGMWLEQLLAESTGKRGKGILPVAGEPAGEPVVYGDDRLFVYLHLPGREDEDLDRKVETLKKAHLPVVTIQMEDLLDLGQEFYRWEIATATAGSILEINAFNQPNVQESKDNTNRLLAQVRQTGHLPAENPSLTSGALSVYSDETAPDLKIILDEFLYQAARGDYVALMAYLPETLEVDRSLQEDRSMLRDSMHIATTLGYGPRFLHSTGQYHKGGPNTGLFIQLTADPVQDVEVIGQPYTFGTFQLAQAAGDLQALRQHDRRVLRIHLGKDLTQGLADFHEGVAAALVEMAR